MSESLGLTTVLYALMLCLWSGGSALRRRPRSPSFTVGLAVLEIGVLIQALFDAGALLTGHHGSEVATNVGYLVTSVLVVPITASAVRLDEGRWGSAALAFGCLVLIVVSIRLHQTLSVNA